MQNQMKLLLLQDCVNNVIFVGKAGFMIPFIERRSYLDIEQFSTDVRTSESVPTRDFINVRADAAVKLKIGTSDEMIAKASENFLELEYHWHF